MSPTPGEKRTLDIRQLIRYYLDGHRDFRDLDLTGFILYGVNLRHANFSRSNLSQVKLFEADLRGCNFNETNLI